MTAISATDWGRGDSGFDSSESCSTFKIDALDFRRKCEEIDPPTDREPREREEITDSSTELAEVEVVHASPSEEEPQQIRDTDGLVGNRVVRHVASLERLCCCVLNVAARTCAGYRRRHRRWRRRRCEGRRQRRHRGLRRRLREVRRHPLVCSLSHCCPLGPCRSVVATPATSVARRFHVRGVHPPREEP
jgi:hypothetical protein